MVASEAAPQLKSVFCWTRLLKRRSRTLSICLKARAPPGSTAKGSWAAWARQGRKASASRANGRMIVTPLSIPGEGRLRCRSLHPQITPGSLHAARAAGRDGQRVALLVAHARGNVGADVTRHAVERTADR